MRVNTLLTLLLPLMLGVLGAAYLLSTLDTVASGSAPWEQNVTDKPVDDTAVSTVILTTPTPSITKTTDPLNPDTGGMVTICFTIQRPELDVVLVQDVSGSMRGGKLADSKVAARTFVDQLRDTDRGAVVPYSNTAYLAQPLTTDGSKIKGVLANLRALEDWDTNIGEGISVSHKELITSPRYAPDTLKAIVLLSDGQANFPGGPQQAKPYARERAEAAASHSIKIFTIGFGGDADEELLEYMAGVSGGRYYFAPEGDQLGPIYRQIASELHSLVITDILPAHVKVDCPQEPPATCLESLDEPTTVIWHISDDWLISNPLTLCFRATVNVDPNYEGPINLPGSDICYQDSDEQTICSEFDNPTVSVGGRKITGHVFNDLDRDGLRDGGEKGAEGIVVGTSTGLTATTDASGNYVLRISDEPPLLVTVASPGVQITTLPISEHVPAATGTYTVNFGVCRAVYLPAVMKRYAAPSLRLSAKTTKTMGRPGETLQYVITLINSGTTQPISGSVTDPIPANTTYITGSVTGGGWFENNRICWSGTLAPEENHAIEFEVRIDFNCPITVTNTAEIREDTGILWSRPVTMYVPCLINGGFEEEWTGWAHGGATSIVTDTDIAHGNRIIADTVHSGSFSARLGNPLYDCWRGVPTGTAWISQTVFVPSTTAPALSFYYRILTHDKNSDLGDEYDSFDVKINGELAFRDMNTTGPLNCDTLRDLGWREKTIPLHRYRGSYITISFENWTRYDNWYNTWTYVDDVRITP